MSTKYANNTPPVSLGFLKTIVLMLIVLTARLGLQTLLLGVVEAVLCCAVQSSQVSKRAINLI